MVEVGITKYFGMAKALGIIATMIVVLYFSRKHYNIATVMTDSPTKENLDFLSDVTVNQEELIIFVDFLVRLFITLFVYMSNNHEFTSSNLF